MEKPELMLGRDIAAAGAEIAFLLDQQELAEAKRRQQTVPGA